MPSLLRGILPNEGNMQCGDVKVRLSSGMTGVGLIAVAIYRICKGVFDKQKRERYQQRDAHDWSLEHGESTKKS